MKHLKLITQITAKKQKNQRTKLEIKSEPIAPQSSPTKSEVFTAEIQQKMPLTKNQEIKMEIKGEQVTSEDSIQNQSLIQF